MAELTQLDPTENVDSYIERFNLTDDHLPELAAVLNDADAERIHVVRAIAELGGAKLLIDFAKAASDLPWVFEEVANGLADCEEVELVADALQETAHNDYIGEIFVEALILQAEENESIKPILVKQLEQSAKNGTGVNGRIIAWLTSQKAVDTLPVIESAYKHQQVDQLYAGNWDSVQVAMGVKDPDPDAGKNSMELLSSIAVDFKKLARSERRAETEKKKKRKQAKSSKKKNRKK